MSLFKKPKKNIRQRVALNSDEENEDSNDIKIIEPKTENDDSLDGATDITNDVSDIKKKEKKKKKKHQEKAVISFVDEEEEGEVFQVKKSSQSRRLAKQIEKEKRRREQLEKESGNGTLPQVKEEPASPPSAQAATSPADVKQEPAAEPPPQQPTILSGRDAEMAGYHSDEDEQKPRHKFTPRSAGSLQHVLQDGAIPDAATIHAVRKRREQARRMQEAAPDFMPLNEESQGSNSRPPREDDDSGPEDDRVTFTVSTSARDREARRDQFNAARDQEDARDSAEDDTELARWENQQIKKAFSSAQLASVTAEHYLLPTNGDDDGSGGGGAGGRLPEPLGPRQRRPLAELTPAAVRQRLTQKLAELRLAQTDHESARDTALDRLVAGQSEIDRLEREAPRAARRYRYYQDIRGYVTDLVECFNEKLPMIVQLESRMLEVLRARTQKVVQRRRTDVRDQRLELDASTQKAGVHYSEQSAGEVAARRRRAAEREGRRTRRRRARELSAGGGAGHQDGLSSDEETAAADDEQFQKDREAVLQEVPDMLLDVEEDFSTLAGVCRHFLEWRRMDRTAYTDAYVSLSLPRAIAPLVRLQMIGWNPLNETEGSELEKFPWFGDLATFGASGDAGADTEEGFRQDPDCLLVSRLTERVVLPKITALVERVWDPLSNSETLRLVHLVRQLVRDFPTVTGESVHLQRLLRAVVAAFQRTIDEDASVPRFSPQVLESRSSPSAVFFYRQFTSCCKLLGNMLSWTELVGDGALQRLALGSLLNGSMLLPLTQVPDTTEAVSRCRLVASALPGGWFQGERAVPQLNMFVSYLTMLAVKVSSTGNKTTSLKAISGILKKVGASEAWAKVEAMLQT